MYTTLLSPFYSNVVAFDGLTRRIVAQLRLLMERRPDLGYFPKPPMSLFIEYSLEEKDAAKRDFDQTVLKLNYVGSGRYLVT